MTRLLQYSRSFIIPMTGPLSRV